MRFKSTQFWLLASLAGLITIHISLVWKSDRPSLMGTSILFWIAITYLIWERRYHLNLESDIFSSFLGFIIILPALIKSASLTSFGGFLDVLPFVFALGLAFIASGYLGLKQYKGELLALLIFGAPKFLPGWLAIYPLTAKLSAFILWYTGFQVTRSGNFIYLPTGSIEVAIGCSGIELIFQMLGLAVIFLLMFPQKLSLKIVVVIVACCIGFIVNGFRVAVMAVIANNQQAFDYWHDGEGSLIFSMIAVIFFGIFCWFFSGFVPKHNTN
jgi:cyanoexosortase A